MTRLAQLLALFAAAGTLGCTASEGQVAPPRYDFYFPSALAVTGDERHLVVVNANSDLRYDSGTIQVLDLDAVEAIATGWTATPRNPGPCAPDPLRPLVLTCPPGDDGAPASFFLPGASVRVGNFGADVGVQAFTDAAGAPTGRARIFAAVRGDPSLTYVDFDGQTLGCDGSGDFPRCGPTHRLAQLLDDPALPTFGTEPFNLSVDGALQRVYVTHLTSGDVTLAAAPNDPAGRPLLVDQLPGASIWTATRTGALGAVGVASRAPGDPSGLVYVTSRAEARVAMLRVATGPGGATGDPIQALVPAGSFLLHGLGAGGQPSEARDLAFSADGGRAYVISRSPAAVLVFDTTTRPTGEPANALLGAIEVCAQPTTLAVADFGDGPRIYVPCFATGDVYVLDGDRFEVIAVANVGRGPATVAVSPTRRRVYVANYADDTIGVLDATPGAPTEHELLLWLGTPRPVER